jgi:hypothetical protein
MCFYAINFYDLQEAQCTVQAFRAKKETNQIVLAVSVKFINELYEGLDQSVPEPGVLYLTNPCSTSFPSETLWPISNSDEGVLSFKDCNLPDKDYEPIEIRFHFPAEILSYAVTSQTPRVDYKFKSVGGKLAFKKPNLDSGLTIGLSECVRCNRCCRT